jgi:hypothetical protein
VKIFSREETNVNGTGCHSLAGNPNRRCFSLILLVLTFIAFLLRLYAATDNFWLDEIFTYFLAIEQVRAISEVFTGIKVEHQPLVTLTMYLLGDQLNWVWYRLTSVIMGTGTLLLMAWAGYRRMTSATLLFTLAVAAVSYPLVVYSSEARGYAPASFFSLAMFIFLDAYWRRGNQAYAMGFWAATALAILYHPAAVCVYISLGLWSFVREWRHGGGLLRVARELALLHAVPVIAVACLYFTVIRQWGSVGGDVLPLTRVLGDTMDVALGLPMRPEFRWWGLLGGGVLITAGLVILARLIRSDIWIFYFSVFLLAPALMLWANGRVYVYVRYFIIQFPFFYLMLGEAMDAAAKRFKKAQVAIVGLGLLMLAGNALATADFLRVGRGGYLNALTYMTANTPGKIATVGSDHDFRNGLTVIFYSRYLPENRSLVYVARDAWPSEGPDWFIIHNTCSEELIPQNIVKIRSGTYRLAQSYPVQGLSGMGWHIYRNDSRR